MFSCAQQTHLKLNIKIIDCLPAKFPGRLLDNATILSKLRVPCWLRPMVASLLSLVSLPVVAAGGGNRVVKSAYMYMPVPPVLLPDGSAMAGIVAWVLQREDSEEPFPR